MRILACPIGTPGLSYPVYGAGLELAARGHEVAVVAGDGPAELDGGGGTPAPPAGFDIARWYRPSAIADQVAAIEQSLARIDADALITSELSLGALIAAERSGLPVLVVGLMGYLWPVDERRRTDPSSDCECHQLWLFNRTLAAYNDARDLLGLRRVAGRCDDRNPLTGDLILVRNVPELVPDAEHLPAAVRFVGPCRWEPAPDGADDADLDWVAARTEPLVYAQLARNFNKSSLWEWLRIAFADASVAVVVERGRSEPDPPTDLPPHMRVVRSGRSRRLLAAARAVISFGSTAPTLGGLCLGRPSLLAPNGAERPIIAEICRRAGVAVELDPAAVPRVQLRRLLEDNALHERAAAAQRLLCGDPGQPAQTDSPTRTADVIETFTAAAPATHDRRAARYT